MQLINRTVQGHKAIFFRYKLSGITFEFSLLCEVAERLKPHFQAMIDDKYPNGVTEVEIDNSPWLITVPR